MRLARHLATMWLALALAFTPAHANAQGGAVVTCAKKIWEFVGKPLTAGAAERAGGLVAEYFADKLKGGAKSGAPSAPPTAPVSIGRNDIEALQRRGLNDCQIRQALDAMYGVAQPYVPPRGYSAQAYCGITGATGTAHNMPSPQQAMQHAVYDCVYRGGVPDCCQRGARVLP
ncbi:MAG: hypothetical protein ABWZ74_04850 [Hyphomicrobiaceae bacterium]